MEVWFPGEHCDVGGGYPEAESGMSKYPLEWMISEASSNQLLIDSIRSATVLGKQGEGYVAASPDAPLHDSMTGLWPLLEFAPKKHWNKDRKKAERIRPPPCGARSGLVTLRALV